MYTHMRGDLVRPMARIILIPSSSSSRRQTLSLAGRRMHKKARADQIKERSESDDPASGELQRFMATLPHAAGAASLAALSVTGVRVVDVPDAVAPTIPAAQLGYRVIVDVPLSLIRPVKTAGVAATDLAGVSKWHLTNIGLDAA